jgi:hypothetical protein
LRKYADQILVATQRMPMSQKREFLKECFEGNRIPVRTLTLGGFYDSNKRGLTVEELSRPVIIKGRKRDKRRENTFPGRTCVTIRNCRRTALKGRIF